MLASKRINGHILLEMQPSDVFDVCSMTNPDHQHIVAQLLDNRKRSEVQVGPDNLWEFKEAHSGYASFLLHAMTRSPRLTLLYLYSYDREGYEFYKASVLGCNGTATTDDWWFHAGSLIAPNFVQARFMWCFCDLHYWVSRFLMLRCICSGLMEFVIIGRSFVVPYNVSLFDFCTKPLITMAIFYSCSYIWWLVPAVLADTLFYTDIYIAPLFCVKRMISQLRRQD